MVQQFQFAQPLARTPIFWTAVLLCMPLLLSAWTTHQFTGRTEKLTIPPGHKYVYLDLFGASGADVPLSNGGNGGRVQCLLEIKPNDEVLFVTVGGRGNGVAGGFNGGKSVMLEHGGGGGGSTDISIGDTSANNRIIVAGGGGGAYRNNDGGIGGLPSRGKSTDPLIDAGMDNLEPSYDGGGGGGGWVPGSSGGSSNGLGGSSFGSRCLSVTYTEGVNDGDGRASVFFAIEAFHHTGYVQSFTLPPHVQSMTVALVGARGGQSATFAGGLGSLVVSTIATIPKQEYFAMVGGQGEDFPGIASGGDNWGGDGDIGSCGGGGATDIRLQPYELSERIAVAAGGGGCGWNDGVGGDGGAPHGSTGSSANCSGDADNVSCGIGGLGAPAVPANKSDSFSPPIRPDGRTRPSGGGGGAGHRSGKPGQRGAGGGGGSSYSIDPLAIQEAHFSNGPGLILLSFDWREGTRAKVKEYSPPDKSESKRDLQVVECTLEPAYYLQSIDLMCVTPGGIPVVDPTLRPIAAPTKSPISTPTKAPIPDPTSAPIATPTLAPICTPTAAPIPDPTYTPTQAPIPNPTYAPTRLPSTSPTKNPTAAPTANPTADPSRSPTPAPTLTPTAKPSCAPTFAPTPTPTVNPTTKPSADPTCAPTAKPTVGPTAAPTCNPTVIPTTSPTLTPTTTPTVTPTRTPTTKPTLVPTTQPTPVPSARPTSRPSSQPSGSPSMQPTSQPTCSPTCQPSAQPTRQPTVQPTRQPSSCPTMQPTRQPSNQPSGQPTENPSTQPSRQPSSSPSMQPTTQPSGGPSTQPSAQPTRQPSAQPSSSPSSQPSRQPSVQPSCQPTRQPTGQPSNQPTSVPSTQPSAQPTRQPSNQPTSVPTMQPTEQPTGQPSSQPSVSPSSQPTRQPSMQPSCQPTQQPTGQPSTQPTSLPTMQPSAQPTRQPSAQPSLSPSAQPSMQPTMQPTCQPTRQPTCQPSSQPTSLPTMQPSAQPTRQPSAQPSASPSSQPSSQPTRQPSQQPSQQPTSRPSGQPTKQPSIQPSAQPSVQPTRQPTASPSAQPSNQPSRQPSQQPTEQPSNQPSSQPTSVPSAQPSAQPTRQPSSQPSAFPSSQPSCQPSRQPTQQPTQQPTNQPSGQPSAQPTLQPSNQPSTQPSRQPSASPSSQPSNQPSRQPSQQPTGQPSNQPSSQPSSLPTMQPSAQPTRQPSSQPSSAPTSQPSSQPSMQPTRQPSQQPTSRPSGQPSTQPSIQPSAQPSVQPTRQPSASPSAQPSNQPSRQPTQQPTMQPTNQPSSQPTSLPTVQPSAQPTRQPSSQPSSAPSSQPSNQPSMQPTGQPSSQPSAFPSAQPSCQPTRQPTQQPTQQPTTQPSGQPSTQPTTQPSRQPSQQPTQQPTCKPSGQPSSQPTFQPSSQPSMQPTMQPSSAPSAQPSNQPSRQPSQQPTMQPTNQPSGQPSAQPSGQPSAQPSMQPTRQPSSAPSAQPSSQPSRQPSQQPTMQPTSQPSAQPTSQPSQQPTGKPSRQPSGQPSSQPSSHPSNQPSGQPSASPSGQPSASPSSQPTSSPTCQPSAQPTLQPSKQPSAQPSASPSAQPSCQPSIQPSGQPSRQPSRQPSAQPTAVPTSQPSRQPTRQPTSQPTVMPSRQPSTQPTQQPSGQPTSQPSRRPSTQPTSQPSSQPTMQPTRQPSSTPSSQPSSQPSLQPSQQPTQQPSAQPSSQPTSSPSCQPTSQPSAQPTSAPSAQPSGVPSMQPTQQPSSVPTNQPTTQPSAVPSRQPSSAPSTQPSAQPSGLPTSQPSAQPSVIPSSQPSACPTTQPSTVPSGQPSAAPSIGPTSLPTVQPSAQPTSIPSVQPSSQPSGQPSGDPTGQPTSQPSSMPSSQPSGAPSAQPTVQPSAMPSTQPSAQPSSEPTGQPSSAPSMQPSSAPSSQPSALPTSQPSSHPSSQPSTAPSSQPSASPSSQPSRQPTEQPSKQPSTQPSRQPTGKPSTQPAARPSAQPSGSPTSVPTTQPSGSPSTQPSVDPTGQPTSQPSCQPSCQPTTQPSRQPYSHPSGQPTSVPSSKPTSSPTALQSGRFIYSRSPSVAPTLSPTLSEAAAWSNKLQSTLGDIASNDTSAVVHRSTYYELDVLSNTPYEVYGGCAAWSSVISSDMKPSQLSYNVRSVAVTALADFFWDDRPQSYSTALVTCDDSAAATKIVAAITTSPKRTSTETVSATFQCEGKSWVVRHCPVTTTSSTEYSPAVCVGCADPCAATAHCGGQGTDPTLAVSPCVQSQCPSPLNALTGLRVLTVGYGNIEQAPLIKSVSTAATKSAFRISVQLSSAGTVYAAVYRSSATPAAPTSLNAVLLQNNVATTNAANVSTITIQGLDASTTYNIYFLTSSPVGVKSSLEQVLASVRTEDSGCCKTITAAVTSASVIEMQSTKDFLVLTASSLPGYGIYLRLALFAVPTTGNATLYRQSLFPAELTLMATASSTVLKASLPALPIGVYEYRVTVVGTSDWEYRVVYGAALPRFEVVSIFTEPPVPSLTQAEFASDGSYAVVKFSSSTNRGGTQSSFACSALFSFDCAATSKCQWIDLSTVHAYIKGPRPSSTCAKPESTLTLQSTAVIKAKCQAPNDNGNGAGCSTYSAWQKVAAVSIRMSAPASPLVPTVAISAPSVIGSCDDLSLDVSGSTGSGGRSWINTTFSVLSTLGTNTTSVDNFLRKVTTLTPPPVVAARMLEKGTNYNFVVKMCNFLGQCGIGSKRVLVLNDTVPSVSLLGSALRMVARKSALSIGASAFISTCSGGRSTSGLQYSWRISSNNVALLTLSSGSKDPSKYLLPAYALNAGEFYQISLTVNAAGSAQASTATTQVYVQPGNIFAILRGSTIRSVRVSEPLALDASGSYDDDVIPGTASGLQFTWSCAQIAPAFNSSCLGAFSRQSLRTMGGAVVELTPRDGSAGTGYQFTVEVIDRSLKRTAKASVTVNIQAALAPTVSLSAPNVPLSRIINAGQILQLSGAVSVPASLGGNATWAVDDSSIVLADVALFSPTSIIAPLISAGPNAVTSKAVYMAFPGNTFSGGRTLTFSLVGAIPYQGKQASASISITINAPPTPGSFYVDPSEGVELTDKFQFVASQWVDSDLPITYQFSYISASGLETVLKSRSELSYGTSLLPAGRKEQSYGVVATAQVFDFLNANASAAFDVTVTTSTEFNASQVDKFVRESFAANSNNADDLKQATALSSYLLNMVNCTLAPNCTERHRQACLTTPHTCGKCESDTYIGEEGDSNEECLSIYDGRAVSRYLLQEELPLVDTDLKPCAANCSGHGTCIHVLRDSGNLVTPDMPPCVSGSLDCIAVCECEDAYLGSDTCDVTTEEFAQRQANRQQVIAGLQKLISLENPDDQSIGGWINGLAQASQSAAELSEESSLSVLSLVDTITAAAVTTSAASATGQLAISQDTMAGLLGAVNSVASAASASALRRRLSAQRRGLAVNEVATAANPVVVRDVINNFGSLVSLTAMPGQDAVQFRQDEFRMSVQVLSNTGDDAATAETTTELPLTPQEKFLGRSASSVKVPKPLAGSAPGHIVTTSLRSELFSSLDVDLNSNPLTVYSSAKLCSTPPCNIEVVIQNSQSVDFTALAPPPGNITVNATCADADYSVHNITCPNGHVVTLTCSGTAGVVSQVCPVVQYSTTCNLLNTGANAVLSGTASGCKVIKFSDTSVTCSCDALTSTGSAQNARRKLVQAGYNFTEPEGYSVSYVAMLQATTDNFVSTIQTADDLNASTVARGWRALATLGSLAAAIIVGILWSHHYDNLAKKVTPTDGDKSKQTPANMEIAKAARKSGKGGSRKVRFNSRSKKALVNAELAIVEDSLPKVLSSRTFTDRFLEEVKQHHRWFGIIFYFSDSFPRVLRVVSLATNAIVMLFIQSITYNLTNPDDGTCELLLSETDCLQPKSPFATGESKCAWVLNKDAQASTPGMCVYVEPDQSVRIILFVAIFCAIVTTPIALAADWVVLNVLCAPTKHEVVAEQEADATSAAATAASAGVLIGQRAQLSPAPQASKDSLNAASSVVPAADLRKTLTKASSSQAMMSYIGLFNDQEKAKDDMAILAASRAELLMLSLRLRKYRDSLSANELEEFNLLWGLDAEGKFITTTTAETTSLLGRLKATFFKKEDVNVKEAVLMDLKRIHETVRREAAALKAANAPKFEIGRKLLFLFQCDLLPGISGKILDLKGSRDTANVKHVSLQAKIAGWTFLFLLDTGMLFYILLFALTQTGPRQNAWFQSFALWLVVEILIVSTAIVFITHIVIPSLIMKDITQIKRRLMDNIRDFNDKVQESKETSTSGLLIKSNSEIDDSAPFNAANYLFVSTRLARQFPDLKESKIIAHFSTPWPRQSYLRVQNVSKNYSKKFAAITRSASILLIFFVGNFLSVPPSIQDILVQMTTTTAVGYTMLIHVQLFEIFPALVILPALALLVLVHFFIQSGKADAQLKLARLFPSKAKKNTAVPGAAYVDEKAIVVAVAEGAHVDEEGKSSDDEYDYGSGIDSSGHGSPAIALPNNMHKTRRQSITAGLDLIHSMQERARRGEAVFEAASEDSDYSVSSEESDAAQEVEQLHTAKGTQHAFHRVLARGVPFLNRSRASNYSVDLSIPSNSQAGSAENTESDSDTESDSTADDAAQESDVSSQLSDNCSSSSASSSDTDTDTDNDGDNLHGENEIVGELNRTYRSPGMDAHSLSTISNQVPAYLREERSEVTEGSSCDTESISISPLKQTVLPICTPPGNPGIGDIPLPGASPAEGGELAALGLHVAVSTSPVDHSSTEYSSSSESDESDMDSRDNMSDLSASVTEGAHARRAHVVQAAPIQIMYATGAPPILSAPPPLLPAVRYPPPPLASLLQSHANSVQRQQSSEESASESHSGSEASTEASDSGDDGEENAEAPAPLPLAPVAAMELASSDSASHTSAEEEEGSAESSSGASSSGYDSVSDLSANEAAEVSVRYCAGRKNAVELQLGDLPVPAPTTAAAAAKQSK